MNELLVLTGQNMDKTDVKTQTMEIINPEEDKSPTKPSPEKSSSTIVHRGILKKSSNMLMSNPPVEKAKEGFSEDKGLVKPGIITKEKDENKIKQI